MTGRFIAGCAAAGMTGCLSVALATSAMAADTTEVDLVKKDASEKNVFTFDYGVPSSPALLLAGQSPDKIAPSTALKPFVLQIPTAAGSSGQTVGLDVAPAWLIATPSLQSASAYARDPWLRLGFRTHLGLAVAQGIDNTDATKKQPSRLAFGFSTSLLGSSDPLMARLPDSAPTGPSAWDDCISGNLSVLQKEVDELGAKDPDKAALTTEFNQAERELAGIKASGQSLKAVLEILQQADDAHKAAFADRMAALQAELAANAKAQTAAEQNVRALSDKLKEGLATANKALQAEYKKSEAAQILPRCVALANFAARYGASLDVGGGALWNGHPGSVSGLEQSGYVAWVSYRHLLGSVDLSQVLDPVTKALKTGAPQPAYWMYGVSARSSWSELVATGVAATPMAKVDNLDAWVGVERISETTRFTLQAGYQYRRPLTPVKDFSRQRFRYFTAITQRIGPKDNGIWLQLGYGDVTETSGDKMVSLSVLFSAPTAASILGVK